MSLWHIQTVSPCMSYPSGACVPPPGPSVWMYNKYLLTCPRHYRETVVADLTGGFFYNSGTDRLIYHTWLYKTDWPSWDVRRYEFDAATGALVGNPYGTWTGIWGSVYSNHPTTGSLGKVYACRGNETAIREVSSEFLLPVAGGWVVDPYTWSPRSMYSFVVVNLLDNLLVAGNNWTLDCWRNISTTPVRFATLRLPNLINSICYESRKYCWVITKDGVILKANYQIPRWEMISTVQNPSTDTLKYLITFDTKRNRVVVLRIRPDAVDGACQIQLEFYYPMVKPAYLTQPVPVSSLRSGNRVLMAANLIGDAGEGLTPYTVTGAMAPPVEGYLVTPVAGTELNGRVCFQYQAPDQACTETLQLSVTVEEA